MALKTNVYIDAFNLYYGCLHKTPYRWLDLNRNFVAAIYDRRKSCS